LVLQFSVNLGNATNLLGRSVRGNLDQRCKRHPLCHDLDTLPIGIAIKIVRNKVKTIYDAHEEYSNMIGDFAPSSIGAVIAAIERLLPRKADAAITVNEMLANRIQNRHVFVVRNTPDSYRGPDIVESLLVWRFVCVGRLVRLCMLHGVDGERNYGADGSSKGEDR
jgi:hypothetical protein